MTVGEVRNTIEASGGKYLEFAYHYPGEGTYFRLFSLASGQVVIALVRGSGPELREADLVSSYFLPPKSFI